MNQLSRRRFLKIGAGTIAAGAALNEAARLIEPARAAAQAGVHTVPTFCNICFWECGAIASVRDGKLWKIEGNPLDPLSRGRLCPRGTGGIGAQFDPDRLRSPLVRVSERGEEKWKAVTWDEALGVVAEKMLKIKNDYGPESFAAFIHGLGGTFFKHTLRAYGSNNIAAPSFAQCRGPRDVGFTLTYGDDVSSPERTDIENAQCIVLIGSHLGENMHNTQVQEFASAVGRGASIIVVDPRFSVAASKARFYLPVKAGTDIALLLAWMNVIVAEKLYDKEYIDKYGFGFDQFAAEIQPFTPEWAYPEIRHQPARAVSTRASRFARLPVCEQCAGKVERNSVGTRSGRSPPVLPLPDRVRSQGARIERRSRTRNAVQWRTCAALRKQWRKSVTADSVGRQRPVTCFFRVLAGGRGTNPLKKALNRYKLNPGRWSVYLGLSVFDQISG